MTVQAKFRCTEKTSRTSTHSYSGEPGLHDSEEVKFNAVYGPGNEHWSKFTPSGELKMQITNPAALSQFEVGKDYLLTIEAAPKAEAPKQSA
jgi:hypothetical protein